MSAASDKLGKGILVRSRAEEHSTGSPELSLLLCLASKDGLPFLFRQNEGFDGLMDKRTYDLGIAALRQALNRLSGPGAIARKLRQVIGRPDLPGNARAALALSIQGQNPQAFTPLRDDSSQIGVTGQPFCAVEHSRPFMQMPCYVNDFITYDSLRPTSASCAPAYFPHIP